MSEEITDVIVDPEEVISEPKPEAPSKLRVGIIGNNILAIASEVV